MAKTRSKSSKSIIRTRSFVLRGKNGKEDGVFTGTAKAGSIESS